MNISEMGSYTSATHKPVANEPHDDDVTQLLAQWRKGSPEAEAELMERVQGELRRLAASYLRRERGGQTLQPTAVVNEAYIRLLPQRGVSWENRAHFFGIAAKMMRRVLVDHARRRHAAKRDAGPAEPVSISGVASPAREADHVDVLALHDALSKLADLDAPAVRDRGDAVLRRPHRRGNRAGPGHLDGHGEARVGDLEDVAQTADARAVAAPRTSRLEHHGRRGLAASERGAGGGAAVPARRARGVGRRAVRRSCRCAVRSRRTCSSTTKSFSKQS